VSCGCCAFAAQGASALVLLALASGCAPQFGPNARNGITFYCPGAGNIDFGDTGLREGLQEAGYQGDIATFVWTISLNPAIDQTLRLNARLRASQLADIIADYIDRYPGRPVHLVGLSAGTGVAIWALEDLKSRYRVDNVVLLSSSLSHDYDVSKALRHVRGKIYNYYSSEDPVLTLLMKPFGTIDGKLLADAAGAVGLHPRRGAERVVNTAWRPEYQKYGYYGHHTDATNPRFVQAVLSRHIIEPQPVVRRETAPATAQRSALLAASRD